MCVKLNQIYQLIYTCIFKKNFDITIFKNNNLYVRNQIVFSILRSIKIFFLNLILMNLIFSRRRNEKFLSIKNFY